MANKDGAQQEETQGQPNPESLDTAKGQAHSEPEYVTLGQFSALQESITRLERSLQSDKDRAVKRTNERLESLEGDLKTVLSGALERGETVEQVLGRVQQQEQDELNQSLLEMARAWKQTTSKTLPDGKADESGVNVSKVLAELELDVEDTRVKDFAGRRFASEAEAYREAARLQKQIFTKKPTEADEPGSPPAQRFSADEQQGLMSQFQEEVKGLTGNAYINKKLEYRKKGLNID